MGADGNERITLVLRDVEDPMDDLDWATQGMIANVKSLLPTPVP
jgi:hypothetical protein